MYCLFRNLAFLCFISWAKSEICTYFMFKVVSLYFSLNQYPEACMHLCPTAVKMNSTSNDFLYICLRQLVSSFFFRAKNKRFSFLKSSIQKAWIKNSVTHAWTFNNASPMVNGIIDLIHLLLPNLLLLVTIS